MRLDTAEYQSTQAEERTAPDPNAAAVLMTPARRAALDALEREFQDLLKSKDLLKSAAR